MKAIWNDVLLAESDTTKLVEGNNYFPPDSVQWRYLQKSDTPYTCPWKGVCTYYNVVVNDVTLEDSAWAYEHPKDAAAHIAEHVAFAHQIQVE